jgi:toxin ParE1/3/4
MHFPVTYSSKAAEDIIDIWLYLDAINPSVAEKMEVQIKKTCENLSEFPLMGQEQPEISYDLRRMPSPPYIILYRALDNCIEIIRVIHAARYLPDIL